MRQIKGMNLRSKRGIFKYFGYGSLSVICLVLVLGLACFILEPTLFPPKDPVITALKKHVQHLSSEPLQGRFTGSAGEKLAMQYVANLFQSLGLEPAGDKGSFFQDFDCALGGLKNTNIGSLKSVQNHCHGWNVLAKLRIKADSKTMVVIGAHGDHLGLGQFSASREPDKEQALIHFGADDNASGVASVLEAARTLSSLKQNNKLKGNKDILFAIWSGEEIGLLGSSHFVKEFASKTANTLLRPRIDANINLDMVGRLREHLIIQGTGSSPGWLDIINKSKQQHDLSVLTQRDPYLPTDSMSFYLNGVPTINLFTGSHEQYHTSSDKPETLNYEGLKSITAFLVDLVVTLEEEEKPIAYLEVPKKNTYTAGGLKIYLGTIPDYSSNSTIGVTLSGVAKGSPAEEAGLKRNDVIIELSNKKIHDLYEYTAVLNKLVAQKPVELVVLRKKTPLRLTIIAKARA